MGNTPKSCPVLAPWRPRRPTEKAGGVDAGAVWGRSVVEAGGGGGEWRAASIALSQLSLQSIARGHHRPKPFGT